MFEMEKINFADKTDINLLTNEIELKVSKRDFDEM